MHLSCKSVSFDNPCGKLTKGNYSILVLNESFQCVEFSFCIFNLCFDILFWVLKQFFLLQTNDGSVLLVTPTFVEHFVVALLEDLLKVKWLLNATHTHIYILYSFVIVANNMFLALLFFFLSVLYLILRLTRFQIHLWYLISALEKEKNK